MKKFLLILLICWHWNAFALELGDTSSGSLLTSSLQYLEDPQGKLTLEDMARPEVAALYKYPADPNGVLNFGITKSTYWLRLPLQQATGNNDEWLIELSYALLNKVNFYAPGAKPVITGGDFPIATRPFFDRYFVFPIKLKNTEQYYYFKIRSDNSITLPLRVWTAAQLIPRVQQTLAIQFLYFGSMMGLALFTLFMYFLVHDTRYALYAAYAVSVALSMTSGSGVARMFFWPDIGAFDSIARNFFLATAASIAMYLSGLFLKVEYGKEMVAWKWKASSLYFCVCAALLFISLIVEFPFDFLNRALFAGGLIAGSMIFLTVVRVFLTGQASLRYFCLSWIVFWTGIFFGIARTVGLVPTNVWTSHAVQIASLTEVILLFLALADQFRSEQQRRFDAQNQLLAQFKSNNEFLEKSVSDRTIKLNESLAHERTVLEQYKRFSTLISHEIRNPLGIIKSQLSLLNKDKERTALQLDKRAKIIGSACSRLESIFNKWLQNEKLSSSLKDIDPNPLPLRVWLTNFLNTNLYCLIGSRVKIHEITDDILLTADENLLDTALGNLIDNARKYAGLDSNISIGLRLNSDQLGLVVLDQGPGISTENQKKIFEEYFRISPGNGVPGIGLGLSIVNRIVVAHGGQVELESQPGQGCAFILWFPRTA